MRDLATYSPIGFICILAKTFGRILLFHLKIWISKTNALGEKQAGFRKGYSCMDHCLTLHYLVSEVVKGQIFVCNLHISKIKLLTLPTD